MQGLSFLRKNPHREMTLVRNWIGDFVVKNSLGYVLYPTQNSVYKNYRLFAADASGRFSPAQVSLPKELENYLEYARDHLTPSNPDAGGLNARLAKSAGEGEYEDSIGRESSDDLYEEDKDLIELAADLEDDRIDYARSEEEGWFYSDSDPDDEYSL